MNPLKIGDKTISSVSLVNFDEIARLDLPVGDLKLGEKRATSILEAIGRHGWPCALVQP